MCSIKVYDAKQNKWVPYIPDYNKWYQKFKDLSDGYVERDHMGCYIVGSGRIGNAGNLYNWRLKNVKEK